MTVPIEIQHVDIVVLWMSYIKIKCVAAISKISCK